ncbi:hypothetical protein ALC57_12995 [Trachymyrmex cornetzi]|uniref:Uncharacterized protein n=1 Tax=Trachymyrmex cornetzi TaxID=471704 RepID=A0A151J057_9HYME|nr:hypothetical protein ALC57_12995 [Trachymyrmex cornetzi]
MRTSLKSQLTSISNLLEKEYDKAALKLRMTRVTHLYHAYEEFNDELILLDPNENHKDEFANVQERFYSLAGKIDELLNSTVSDNTTVGSNGAASGTCSPVDASAVTVAKRKIKLPVISLPNFDGHLSEVEKLQYLQSALKGEAANKLKILTVDGTNYQKAWELLKRAYEVKRVLISRHLSLLINLPILEKETTDGLSRLADDAQQHVTSLNALGVEVGSEILVNILESKLPKNTAEKWEETLKRDEFPKIDELYEFLYRTAVRVSKRARPESFKREDDKFSPAVKNSRTANKIFTVNLANNCAACKNKVYPLFKCDTFKRLDIPKRIEIVKNAKLCYNCLCSHKGRPCNYTICTICQKRHNTLLHLNRYPPASTKTGVTD